MYVVVLLNGSSTSTIELENGHHSYAERYKSLRTVGTEQFLQRQRVLALWREIVRALTSKQHTLACIGLTLLCYQEDLDAYACRVEIPRSSTRAEMRQYARDEFERNRDVTDLVTSSLHDPVGLISD